MQKRRKILNNQGFGLMSVVIAIGVIATVALNFILNRTDFILFLTAFGAIVGGLVKINERKQKRSLKMINIYLAVILSKSETILAESLCFKKQYEIIEKMFSNSKNKDSSLFFEQIKLEHIVSEYNNFWKSEEIKLHENIFIKTRGVRNDPFSVFLHEGTLSLNITSDTISNIQNLKKKDRNDIALLINYVLWVIQKINAIDTVFKEVNIVMRDIGNRGRLLPDQATLGLVEVGNLKSLSILLYDDIRKIFGYSYLARERIKNLYRLYKFDINEVSIQDEKGLIKKFKFISEELSEEGEPLISP